jgi:hypothetical protein
MFITSTGGKRSRVFGWTRIRIELCSELKVDFPVLRWEYFLGVINERK